MKNSNSKSAKEKESEPANIELYRTAFNRLNFQDEYLFKFSAVFLTAHGALAVLAGTTIFQVKPEYLALVIISIVGIFLAIAWWLWTRHNDYWHSIWIGALKEIEPHLKTEAKLFNLDHHKLARQGKRDNWRWLTGHKIAKLIPSGFFFGWAAVLLVSILKY